MSGWENDDSFYSESESEDELELLEVMEHFPRIQDENILDEEQYYVDENGDVEMGSSDDEDAVGAEEESLHLPLLPLDNFDELLMDILETSGDSFFKPPMDQNGGNSNSEDLEEDAVVPSGGLRAKS